MRRNRREDAVLSVRAFVVGDGMFTPETLIRIAFNEGKWRAVRND